MSQPDYDDDLVFPPKSPEWQIKAKAVLDLCKPEFKWIAMDDQFGWNAFMTKPETTSIKNWMEIGVNNRQHIPPCLGIPRAPCWEKSLIERS